MECRDAPTSIPDSRLPTPDSRDRRWIGLCLIVVGYLALAASYAVAIPIWQSPDEPAHYNYLAEIAETGQLPVLEAGDYDGAYLETLKSRGFPADLPVDRIRYEGHQPPLYYLAGALVYPLVATADLPDRVLLLRWLSIVCGALALVVTFLIGRLILPGWLALGPPLLIAAIPQRLAITASINNDAAAELMMAVFLFALIGALLPDGARLPEGTRLPDGARFAEAPVRRPGARLARFLGHPLPLGVILGLLLLTKSTLYIGLLLVPLAFALAPTFRPASRPASRPAGRPSRADRAPSPSAPSPATMLPIPSARSAPLAGPLAPGKSIPNSPSPRQSPPDALPLPESAPSSLSLWERVRVRAAPILRRTLLTWLIAGLVSGWWFLRNMMVYGPADPLAQARHDAIVAGQPTTALSIDALGHFGATLFRSFWGQFGWMGVPLDDRTYRFLTLFSIALAVGVLVWLAREIRRGGPPAWDRRWLTLLAATCLLLFLGVIGYNLKYIQPQGRYLFTALVPIGVFATLGVRGWLPDRWAALGLLALVPPLLVLDLWSLNHVIRGHFG